MLNPALRKAMLPEYRVLYDMKIHLQDEQFKEKISSAVRHIRKINRRTGIDKSQAKLDKYGNKGGWYIERARKLAKKIYDAKSVPRDKDSLGRWRSIEFECIFKSNEALEEFTHAVRAVGLSDFVSIHKDNSVKRNPYDTMGVPGNEVVISYRSGNEDAVRRLCRCLKGRAYVNSSCGTHFHIDMRHMDQEKVTEYGARLAQAVPALRLLLPNERRENKHCSAIINTTKTQCVNCGKLSCNCHVQPHKYAFINLAAYNKHKTIEIRGHSGTLNAEKILNWIRLCEHIMNMPFAAPVQVNTIDELIERYKLDKELVAYVKDRYAKFNDSYITNGWGHKYHKTEEEENPADSVEVVIPPSLLENAPKPKQAQAAPAMHVQFVGQPLGGQWIVGNNQ